MISLSMQRKDYKMVRTYAGRLLSLRPDAAAALEGSRLGGFRA